MDTLGWIHYRRAAYADAEKLLARAVEQAPNAVEIQYYPRSGACPDREDQAS